MKKEYLIYKLSEDLKEATRIENELFRKFDVKRGLRNEDGTGVLVGLTKIGNVVGYERIPGGGLKPIPGKLFYRGYDVDDLAHAIIKEKRFGFEEIAYLLLSGRLPDKEELSSFRELINDNMPLEQKTKMNIIELEGNNIMNILSAAAPSNASLPPRNAPSLPSCSIARNRQTASAGNRTRARRNSPLSRCPDRQSCRSAHR